MILKFDTMIFFNINTNTNININTLYDFFLPQ